MCEICKQNAATVFIARVENGKASQQSLCESCAREHSGGDVWMQVLGEKFGFDLDALQQMGADPFSQFPSDEFPSDEDLADDLAELMEAAEVGLNEVGADEDGIPISDEAFAAMMKEAGIDIGTSGADFAANFNASLDSNLGSSLEPDSEEAKAFEKLINSAGPPSESLEPEPNQSTPTREVGREISAERCSKCGTTWDRLREDGRAGCAHCYTAFHEKLVEVMNRMQREAQHVGKTPREAQRRHRRLEHLRTRRDHRLEMLQRRLQEAVTSENFEDAAQLRDKIRIVSSTIVSDEP